MGFAFIFESVGGTEWFVLLGVILIVVGPKNLPSAARKLGQIMTKLRRAADEFKRQLMSMDQEVRNQVNSAVADDTSSLSSSDSSAEDRADDGGDDLYSDDNPYPGHDDFYDETYGGNYDGESSEGSEGSEATETTETTGTTGTTETTGTSAPAQPPPPTDEELRRVKITVSAAPRKGA